MKKDYLLYGKMKKKHHHLKFLGEIYDDYMHKPPGHLDREFQTYMGKARTTMSMLKAFDEFIYQSISSSDEHSSWSYQLIQVLKTQTYEAKASERT